MEQFHNRNDLLQNYSVDILRFKIYILFSMIFLFKSFFFLTLHILLTKSKS
jgi:hypothetical protein